VIVVVVFGGEGNGECFCWIAGFAPELEVPVGKGAVVGVYGGVFYDDSPVADAGFTLTDVSLKGQRKRNRKERRGEKELTSEVRS
jgi:hypothetical protein